MDVHVLSVKNVLDGSTSLGDNIKRLCTFITTLRDLQQQGYEYEDEEVYVDHMAVCVKPTVGDIEGCCPASLMSPQYSGDAIDKKTTADTGGDVLVCIDGE